MASTLPSESLRASRASFATASFNAGGVWEDKEEWGLSSENRAWLKDNNDSDGHGALAVYRRDAIAATRASMA